MLIQTLNPETATRNTALEAYTHVLEYLAGKDAEVFSITGSRTGHTPIKVLLFRDAPEPGYLTAFTWGLSQAQRPGWIHGGPELCLTVESSEQAWALALGEIAEKLQNTCPWQYGQLLNYNRPLADDTRMSGLVTYAPAWPTPARYQALRQAGMPQQLVGLYPLYAQEMTAMKQLGFAAFWNHRGYDPYAIHRPAFGG